MAHFEDCTEEECRCSEFLLKEQSEPHNPALAINQSSKEWAFINWCDNELAEDYQSRYWASSGDKLTHRCVLISGHAGPHRCNSKCQKNWTDSPSVVNYSKGK